MSLSSAFLTYLTMTYFDHSLLLSGFSSTGNCVSSPEHSISQNLLLTLSPNYVVCCQHSSQNKHFKTSQRCLVIHIKETETTQVSFLPRRCTKSTSTCCCQDWRTGTFIPLLWKVIWKYSL